MKRFLLVVLSLFCLACLVTIASATEEASDLSAKPTPGDETEAGPEGNDILAVEQAVMDAIASRDGNQFVFTAFTTHLDKVSLSEDGKYAFAWMAIQAPETGQVVPGEPGLALLQLQGEAWVTLLPGDPEWEDWLLQTPPDLITPEEKSFWLEINADSLAEMPAGPISGYRLPWEGGKTAYLSGSVSHDEYIESGNAHYAFDFYVPGTSASVMFDLYASKAGTVWLYRDSQPDHSEDAPGNYLVLRDTTTFPVTYQLYLHLAQGSIPPELKVVGAPVARGQYIGVADDTGMSTGNHLHFQVHTEPASYWGRSVDITFDDVAINGGRPRVKNLQFGYNDEPYCWSSDVCTTFQSAYVSGNTKSDPYPPTGGFYVLENDDVVQASSFVITGWAQDVGSGLRRVQIVAAYNGTMVNIGPEFTASPFAYTWDICQANVPDGPISLGLRIFDKQSNLTYLPGLVTVTKSYRCIPPPPACQAGASQVALFAEANYSGACVVLGTGSFTGTGLGIGEDNLASIQVGANVQASLFVDAAYQGRSETVFANDSNLADNLVGANRVSSLVIGLKTTKPSNPQLVWPVSGSAVTHSQSLTLYWRNTGGAKEYQVRLTRGLDTLLTSGWLTGPYWAIGTQLQMYAGTTVNWQVKARNQAGESAWSTANSLVVNNPGASSPATGTLPFSDDVEAGTNGWTANGLWHRESGPSPITARSGSYYWWFGESLNGDERYFSAKQGDLTSPVFNLPGGSQYFLRFWYAYQTETTGKDWDQRWLQIRVGDGPFTNLLQLSDDTMNGGGSAVWLPSPVIDLSPYAGSSVQLRFMFDTIDPSGDSPDNDFEGWYIDDIQITTQAPPVCADGYEVNDNPEQAVLVTYQPAMTLDAQICPGGDVDYYKFQGTAGDYIAVDIDAFSQGSSLDSIVTLLDSDGRSVLAVNDDQDSAAGLLDSLLGYRLPRSGTYYVKVRPWDYPAGGSNYPYTIHFLVDGLPPSVQVIYPDHSVIGSQPVIIQAQASDGQTSVGIVRFFWHSSDWTDPAWLNLGDGQNMGGGTWQVTFDPTGKLAGAGGAFYAQAFDAAGNTMGDGAWDIGIDRTPPVTSLMPISSTQTTTNAVLLRWNAEDALAGLGSYDLQIFASGAWQNALTGLPAAQRQAWVVGTPGARHGFRMRGVDKLGNVEAYPNLEETFTTISSAATLCSSLDGNETDNTPEQAKLMAIGAAGRQYNFCHPAGGTFQNDQDWLRIPVQAGVQFSLLAQVPVGSAAYPQLTLIRVNGSQQTVLAQSAASGIGASAWLTWTPTASENLYVRIQSVDGRIIGTGTNYWIYVRAGPAPVAYLPVIFR
jgi:hypothetical protein